MQQMCQPGLSFFQFKRRGCSQNHIHHKGHWVANADTVFKDLQKHGAHTDQKKKSLNLFFLFLNGRIYWSSDLRWGTLSAFDAGCLYWEAKPPKATRLHLLLLKKCGALKVMYRKAEQLMNKSRTLQVLGFFFLLSFSTKHAQQFLFLGFHDCNPYPDKVNQGNINP